MALLWPPWSSGMYPVTHKHNTYISHHFSYTGRRKRLKHFLVDYVSLMPWLLMGWQRKGPGISSHNIDLVIQKYSGFLIRRSQSSVPVPIVYDASGKPASGGLQGNVRWMGSFSECVNTQAVNVSLPFGGKYCTVTLGNMTTRGAIFPKMVRLLKASTQFKTGCVHCTHTVATGLLFCPTRASTQIPLC